MGVPNEASTKRALKFVKGAPASWQKSGVIGLLERSVTWICAVTEGEMVITRSKTASQFPAALASRTRSRINFCPDTE